MSATLEKELAAYNKNLPELMQHKGKFALIKGDELIGTYTDYEDALQIGYEKFSIDTHFLVKKIMEDEQALFISRDIDFPCPA